MDSYQRKNIGDEDCPKVIIDRKKYPESALHMQEPIANEHIIVSIIATVIRFILDMKVGDGKHLLDIANIANLITSEAVSKLLI